MKPRPIKNQHARPRTGPKIGECPWLADVPPLDDATAERLSWSQQASNAEQARLSAIIDERAKAIRDAHFALCRRKLRQQVADAKKRAAEALRQQRREELYGIKTNGRK